MPFPYPGLFAIDPGSPSNVAADSELTIFDPADPTKSPIRLTDLGGSPMPNPVQTNEKGFVGAFFADLEEVAWTAGGLQGVLQSFEGLRQVAADSAAAASQAALAAANAESNSAASREAAENAAQLVDTPVDSQVAGLVKAGDSQTQAELDVRYALLDEDGRVTPIQLPMASANTPGTVSLGQVNAAAASTVEAAMANTVSVDEIQHNIILDSYSGFSAALPNGIATILYAPYRLRVTRLNLIFDRWAQEANATNYVTFTLRKYDPVAVTGTFITLKHTSQEAVVARKPWGFDAANWAEAARTLEPGQAFSLGWANQGTAKPTFPMLISIGVEPV